MVIFCVRMVSKRTILANKIVFKSRILLSKCRVYLLCADCEMFRLRDSLCWTFVILESKKCIFVSRIKNVIFWVRNKWIEL